MTYRGSWYSCTQFDKQSQENIKSLINEIANAVEDNLDYYKNLKRPIEI